MKLKRRHAIISIVGLALTVLGVCVTAPFVRVVTAEIRMLRQGERGRKHLFLETDYNELLAACRELLRPMPSVEEENRSYHFHRGRPGSEASALPQVILDLESGSKTTRTGKELHEGMDVALSAGVEKRLVIR